MGSANKRDKGRWQENEKRAWIRSQPIQTRFTPGEETDIKMIAKAWGITPAAVVWVIVSDYVQKARRRELHRLPFRGEAKDVLEQLGFFGTFRDIDGMGEGEGDAQV